MQFNNETALQRTGQTGAATVDGGGNKRCAARMVTRFPCVLPDLEQLRPGGQIFGEAITVMGEGVGDTSAVLCQLSLAFLLISTTLLVVYAINPALSGLVRLSDADEGVGLFHPTMAGGTASLGLVLAYETKQGRRWTLPGRSIA